MTHVDIAIVGGGLVGASLAIALAPSGKRVALIEAAAPPKSTPDWDERCIALNVVSRRIYQHLGLWPALAAEAAPITSTHISERGRFGVTRFTAEEAGEEALGWNVPVRHIGAVLWQRLGELPNFTLICPAKVEAVRHSREASRHPRESGGPVSLKLDSGNEVEARLIVACDGAHSAIRTALGIGAQERDYHQVAIVGAVRPERPHHGVAYERFLPGGPLALIPKPDDRVGIIWTVPADEAPKMLAWSDAEFLAALQDAFGQRLGRFLEAGKRNGHPLARVMSDALTAPRVIFAGNAAQALH
ncbi:MAG: FAD-dependent oxidoreductase, partial [Nevskiaceae bacterium]